MNKEIVIYHYPQECGCPFLTIISAENGQVTRKIDLPHPSGYYHSGMEIVEQEDYLYEKTIQRSCKKYPEIGYKEPYFGSYNGKKIVCRVVEEVTPIKDEFLNGTFLYHKFIIRYKYYTSHTECKWVAEKDEYRKEMQTLGFDMSEWHLYKRRKTEYKEFLRSFFPNALNLIFIG